MADSKISALPASTTPLAGTEVLPIVQSSATKQVSVANLTAGRTQTSNGIVQGTAATGYNFTANTPAAGMTSQLLNWYEEGTWTPNQGGGLVVVGTFSSSGTYVKIGNQVTVYGKIVATTISFGSVAIISTNLPFAGQTNKFFSGGRVDANGQGAGIFMSLGSTVYASESGAVSSQWEFSITYLAA
jgi:hypothetical protein